MLREWTRLILPLNSWFLHSVWFLRSKPCLTGLLNNTTVWQKYLNNDLHQQCAETLEILLGKEKKKDEGNKWQHNKAFNLSVWGEILTFRMNKRPKHHPNWTIGSNDCTLCKLWPMIRKAYGDDITPGLIPAHIKATVTHRLFLHKIRRFQPWQSLAQWFLSALTNNLDTECTACLIARLIGCCVSNGNFTNWEKKRWYESWGNVNWDLL